MKRSTWLWHIFLLSLFFRGQESMSSGGWAGAMQRTGASLFFWFQEPRMQTILLWWLLWERQQLQDHKRMQWEMSTYVPTTKHFSSLQFSIITYCFCTSPVIKVICMTKVTALWYSNLHFPACCSLFLAVISTVKFTVENVIFRN